MGDTLAGELAELAGAGSAAFVFYYNYQRPNQTLDDRTPVEEVTNA